jgi:hypothetical protein
MVRAFLCLVAVSGFLAASTLAAAGAQKNNAAGTKADKDNKGQTAKITKVDKANKSITVQMKDKNGKSVERTFRLTEDIRYLDDTGRVAAIDVFQSGNDVLIVEQEGRLKEVRKQKTRAGGGTTR